MLKIFRALATYLFPINRLLVRIIELMKAVKRHAALLIHTSLCTLMRDASLRAVESEPNREVSFRVAATLSI